jgi:hypothetical protein
MHQGGAMIEIGMLLKSDEVIDFLEYYDLKVEYHFDRLREGDSDAYTVESEELSLDMRFDAEQRCINIFVRDIQMALARGVVSFPDLQSPAAIEEYANANSLTLKRGPSWLRVDDSKRCVHYKFEGSELKMVTIVSSDVAP